MATFIQSEPSVNGTTLPANAGSMIRTDQWGIDSTLTGFIIQDVSIAEEAITDVTQDQKGAVVSELDYDKRWTGTMTVIGGDGSEDGSVGTLSVGDTTFSWANKTWKIDNITYRGNYQSKKMYDISFHRNVNFP
jgi:hypothetical protein